MFADRLKSGSRWFWIAFFCLSPLAYVGGVLLEDRVAENLRLGLTLDRNAAIKRAIEFAESKGIATDEWDSFLMAEGNDTLHTYYTHFAGDQADTLRSLKPELTAKVLLKSDSENRNITIEMAPDGRVIEFLRGDPDNDNLPVIEEATSLELAEAELFSLHPSLKELTLGRAEIKTERHGETISRIFTWKATTPALAEIDYVFRVEVRGDAVISTTVRANIEDEFEEASLKRTTVSKVVMYLLIGLTVTFIAIYSVVRYIRRSQQREVSFKRVITLAAILGVTNSVFVLVNVTDQIAIQTQNAPAMVLWLALGVSCLFHLGYGLLVGVAWGAGEGDVREAYPGKLASLDALTLGKVFSGNVSRSILIGAAFGGWTLVAAGLAQMPWVDQPNAGISIGTPAQMTLSKLPGLFAILTPTFLTIPLAIGGLLVPIAFSHRNFKSARLRLGFLGLLAVLGCSWLGAQSNPTLAAVLITLIAVGCLFGAFFYFDLLTAIVGLTAFTISSLMVTLNIFAPHSRLTVIFPTVALIVVTLAAAAYFVRNGRIYREAEVRPLYAEQVEQRKALQAEESAAREAQLRLAPDSIPSMRGLSIAASCLPARTVGGDFYDFFKISPDRMGVFFAEGGGSGLSAALLIAYAKGLLMPLAPRVDDPLEVLQIIRPSVGPLLSEKEGMGILYGVFDRLRGRFEYARLGGYPQVLVSRGDGRPEDPRPPDGRGAEIDSSSHDLTDGDRVVLFTDGVADALTAAQETKPAAWILSFLAQQAHASADDLHEALVAALKPKIKKARRQGVDDDLSTIIVRFQADSGMSREEVA